MKYEVKFQFRNEYGEWVDDYLNNNGKGFTKEDAECVLYHLSVDEVCVKRYLRIEEMENKVVCEAELENLWQYDEECFRDYCKSHTIPQYDYEQDM